MVQGLIDSQDAIAMDHDLKLKDNLNPCCLHAFVKIFQF